eukprot:GEMP01027049.1.p1 GENE.GEMP01027049.1~~GEMP01027049.1.p1  ORF type:complete len:555 (+),score=107.39 GEMP01027049.1:111-1775(+)
MDGFSASRKLAKRSYMRRLGEILFAFAPWGFLMPNHRDASVGIRHAGIRRLKRLLLYIDESEFVIREPEFQELFDLAEMVPGHTVLQLVAAIAVVHARIGIFAGACAALLAVVLVVLPAVVISTVAAGLVMWWTYHPDVGNYNATLVCGKAVLAGVLFEKAMRLHNLYVTDMGTGRVFYLSMVFYLVAYLWDAHRMLYLPLFLAFMWWTGPKWNLLERTPAAVHNVYASFSPEGPRQGCSARLDPDRDHLIQYRQRVGAVLLLLSIFCLFLAFVAKDMFLSVASLFEGDFLHRRLPVPEPTRTYSEIVALVCSFMRASIFGGFGRGTWCEVVPVLMGENDVPFLLEGFLVARVFPGHSRLAAVGAVSFCSTLCYLRLHGRDWADQFRPALCLGMLVAVLSQIVGIIAMLGCCAFWSELREPEKYLCKHVSERYRTIRAIGPGMLAAAAISMALSSRSTYGDLRVNAACVAAVVGLRAFQRSSSLRMPSREPPTTPPSPIRLGWRAWCPRRRKIVAQIRRAFWLICKVCAWVFARLLTDRALLTCGMCAGFFSEY